MAAGSTSPDRPVVLLGIMASLAPAPRTALAASVRRSAGAAVLGAMMSFGIGHPFVPDRHPAEAPV